MDRDLQALQEVRDCLRRTKEAQKKFYRSTQEQVDRVCRTMVDAGLSHCQYLAELAVEETGIGRVDGKVAKNRFALQDAWDDIKDLKTVGIVSRDEARGTAEIAEPFGVVAGVIPTTNPTSTALFKILIALKTRNGIVVSPHPRAVRCISESCRILHEAAVRAGAPEGIISCLTKPTLDATQHLMKHPDTDLILATGGSALVTAAYSAGNPAFGVGPGNVPVYVHSSADVAHAAAALVNSQTFDNGTICCSEQSVVCDRSVAARFQQEMERFGAYFTKPAETKMLERTCVLGDRMNPEIVGLFPAKIAERAGFQISRETTVLVVPYEGVGPKHPLSMEILTPLLTYYVVENEEQGKRKCLEILDYFGRGHTFCIHATDRKLIESWAYEMPVHRYLVNAPTTQGGIGLSVWQEPSMTLGCGAYGKNISGDNITARHLMLVKRFCEIRRDYDEKHIQPMLAGRGADSAPAQGPAVGPRIGASEPAAPRIGGGVLPPVRPYLMDRYTKT